VFLSVWLPTCSPWNLTFTVCCDASEVVDSVAYAGELLSCSDHCVVSHLSQKCSLTTTSYIFAYHHEGEAKHLLLPHGYGEPQRSPTFYDVE
jgi:hypothetical protein